MSLKNVIKRKFLENGFQIDNLCLHHLIEMKVIYIYGKYRGGKEAY